MARGLQVPTENAYILSDDLRKEIKDYLNEQAKGCLNQSLICDTNGEYEVAAHWKDQSDMYFAWEASLDYPVKTALQLYKATLEDGEKIMFESRMVSGAHFQAMVQRMEKWDIPPRRKER